MTSGDDALAPGDAVADRYEIVRRLGAGGMGEVYEAIQHPLGRHVALKVLPAARADDATARRRFEAEAEAVSRLRHPNNITLFDFGWTDEGAAWLAMDLCRGRTLRDVVKTAGRLAPDRALPIAAQVCDAIAEAHAQGIVHRDLKPSNIMLEAGEFGPDTVRVLDYGIARTLDGPELTAPGRVIGTPAYMAPEQARGAVADASTDVYAIGALVYAMLAGRPPITVDEGGALLNAIQTRVPTPLDQLDPPVRVDAPIVSVVQLALAKSPAHRPASVAALGTALRAPPDPVDPVMTVTGTATGASWEAPPASVSPPSEAPEGVDGPQRPGRGFLWAGIAAAGVLGALLVMRPPEDLRPAPDQSVVRSAPAPEPDAAMAPVDARVGMQRDSGPAADVSVAAADMDAAPVARRRPVTPARPLRLRGCRVTGGAATLCAILPTDTLLKCHRSHVGGRDVCHVDAIVRADQGRPAVRVRPANTGMVECVRGALGSLSSRDSSSFTTLQFVLGP